MRFDSLARRLREMDPEVRVTARRPFTVTDICDDSRNVKPGALFAAVSGTKQDGTQYIKEAIVRGAKALLVSREMPEFELPQIVSPHVRRTLSLVAAAFFGEPALDLRLVAVTGTKGKTTSAFLMRHLMQHVGVPCGLIGTVFNITGSEQKGQEAHMTTPGAIEIQRLLATMRDNGLKACAMEVSSHALDQDRCAALSFEGAVFTNLTHEHLDYHKDMESYFTAKARLFELLAADGTGVVNLDNSFGERMAGKANGRALRVGTQDGADVLIHDIELGVDGMKFAIRWPDVTVRFETSLTGRFNAMNIAEVIVLGRALGMPLQVMREAVAAFRGAPGRLERVQSNAGPTVFVDYAHAPDALEQVLQTVREICVGRRLTCIFGCGGDRDRTKRPKMGAIAANIAGRVIVTSDNPRTEDAHAIIAEIVGGIPAQKLPVEQIVDRREAIELAIREARPDEVIVIAGKGHEDYQIFKDRTVHFDDREEAAAALKLYWRGVRSVAAVPAA
ncbi:MAG: UDP-N-acetylmuramoyl-L-alanyl-D-glutamate--2,6-diaminopimelate ligase [Planctomycetes bacterium]|nr:UDP-N-acetylmuramoyl-L-alanyl-D-glutamate--2,6-diaminopimelate ligase [Planctomycetota bacterium]